MALSIDIEDPADQKEEEHHQQTIPSEYVDTEDRKESLLIDANIKDKIPDSAIDDAKEEEHSPKSVHNEVIEEVDEDRE